MQVRTNDDWIHGVAVTGGLLQLTLLMIPLHMHSTGATQAPTCLALLACCKAVHGAADALAGEQGAEMMAALLCNYQRNLQQVRWASAWFPLSVTDYRGAGHPSRCGNNLHACRASIMTTWVFWQITCAWFETCCHTCSEPSGPRPTTSAWARNSPPLPKARCWMCYAWRRRICHR